MSREDTNYPVELGDVTVVKTTDKALLIRTDDGTEAWIPRSLCLIDTTIKAEGDVGTLVIPSWYAEQNGLV